MTGDDLINLTERDLAGWYAGWVQSLPASQFSSEDPSGRWVFWEDLLKARRLATWKAEFAHKGCYLWATRDGIPRLIGETHADRKSLGTRLSERYITGHCSQCGLAKRFSEKLIAGGWQALPDDVLAWYFRYYSRPKYKRMLAETPSLHADDALLAQRFREEGGTTVRIEGAAGFAESGIDEMGFAVVPTSNGKAAQCLEARLIPIGHQWSAERRKSDERYVPLLNKHLPDIRKHCQGAERHRPNVYEGVG